MTVELLTGEEWKQIPDLDGCYLASTLGRIYSISRLYEVPSKNGKIHARESPGRLLKQMLTPSGYLRVQISVNGFKRKYYSHVLIAKTFLEPEQDRTIINHKDQDKTNNNIGNLEWSTNRENSLHGQIGKTKTGVPGIYFHPTRQRFQGSILLGKKRHQIGDHKTLDEAKEAYSKKMIELGLFETRYTP
jgi:hypothetical protein